MLQIILTVAIHLVYLMVHLYILILHLVPALMCNAMKVTLCMEIVFILVKLVEFGWVLEHAVSFVLMIINDVHIITL